MHKKTRYNIRLAEKKGVLVERHGVEALSDWYSLYRETAERDRISIHSEQYYRDLFGIPPTDDPTHPMHGLYRFKNGFGGDRVHRHGAWDFVFRPLAWTLWTRADALRVWYYKVWKKR